MKILTGLKTTSSGPRSKVSLSVLALLLPSFTLGTWPGPGPEQLLTNTPQGPPLRILTRCLGTPLLPDSIPCAFPEALGPRPGFLYPLLPLFLPSPPSLLRSSCPLLPSPSAPPSHPPPDPEAPCRLLLPQVQKARRLAAPSPHSGQASPSSFPTRRAGLLADRECLPPEVTLLTREACKGREQPSRCHVVPGILGRELLL